MTENRVARASTTVDAPSSRVWDALVDPKAIEKYMFGTHVTSEWRVGSPITWKGEFKGKSYEDKGKVLEVEPERALAYTHFSGSGKPDVPENYHTVRIEISPEGANRSRVSLTQDNNETKEALEESEKNWKVMLDGLKKYVEGA
jgi:uncharacterized protein YndB with AHSA1/START domain